MIEEDGKYGIRIMKSFSSSKQYTMDEAHGEIPFYIIIRNSIILQFEIPFQYFLCIFKQLYLTISEIFQITGQQN
jgi:hypothetical protein